MIQPDVLNSIARQTDSYEHLSQPNKEIVGQIRGNITDHPFLEKYPVPQHTGKRKMVITGKRMCYMYIVQCTYMYMNCTEM